MMNKVSIIIPAYNEERRITPTLKAYSEFFESLRNSNQIDYEILVSINNTTDKTPDIVKSFQKKNPRIVYLDLIKGGKGYAIIEGFKDALTRKTTLIGFVDADCSTSPEEFWKLVKRCENADGVIASRYIAGAVVKPAQTLKRIIASRMFNIAIRSLLMMPYRDTQCGAKVFKRRVIEKVIKNLTFSQWAFDADLLYHVREKGFSLVEYPTIWADKEYSKINFLKAGPRMFLGVLRIRLINSPFKSVIRVYDWLSEVFR